MERAHADLTTFLSENIFKTHILKKGAIHFSSVSRGLIGQLFNNISRAERAYQSEELPVVLLDIKRDGLPQGQSYTYCEKPIRDEIESKSRSGYQYKFQINHRVFNVSIISPDKSENVRSYMSKAIKNIYMLLHVVCQYAKPNCSEQMNIYIYLTGLHKMLPKENNDTISKVHANTAFTSSCKTQTEILVFRREEWFKTLAHESCHSLGLDFSAYDNYLINKEMFTMFPVNTEFKLYESYCEMWGEIMAILFNIYRHVRHNTKLEDVERKLPTMIKSVETAITREVYYSLFQVSKILSHYGLTYEELIKDNRGHKGCNYKENTPVLSYFVIKSILMFNIDYFMQWCIHNNGSSISFTNMVENDDIQAKMKRYCNIARQHYKDPAYIDALTQVQEIYKDIKPMRKNSYILENLRMTITEY